MEAQNKVGPTICLPPPHSCPEDLGAVSSALLHPLSLKHPPHLVWLTVVPSQERRKTREEKDKAKLYQVTAALCKSLNFEICNYWPWRGILSKTKKDGQNRLLHLGVKIDAQNEDIFFACSYLEARRQVWQCAVYGATVVCRRLFILNKIISLPLKITQKNKITHHA